MTKELALGFLAILFFCVMVSCALTGLYLWDMAHTCSGSGGAFSIDGGTAWCRY